MPHPERAGARTFVQFTNLSRAACYFAAFFVLALLPASIGPTLADLARQTGTNLRDVSVLFAMRSLGYLISVRFIGMLYDSKPGHPIMISALLISATLFFTIPMLDRLWIMAFVVFLLGIAGAFIDLGGNILILRAIKERVGAFMNGLHFSFSTGAFVAPLIVAASLIVTGSSVYTYWVIATLSFPVAWLIVRTPSPPQPAAPSSDDSGPMRLPRVQLGRIVVFFFLYGGAENSLGGWIHTYGIMRNDMDETTAAYLTSAFWGTFTVGRLLAIPLTARFLPGTLLFTQLTTSCALVLILLFIPPAPAVTWLLTILIGLCFSSVFPLTLTFLERVTAGSGRITSWFFVGASSGAMTLPWFIGQFIETHGPQFFVLVMAVSSCLGTVMLFRIAAHLKRTAPGRIPDSNPNSKSETRNA